MKSYESLNVYVDNKKGKVRATTLFIDDTKLIFSCPTESWEVPKNEIKNVEMPFDHNVLFKRYNMYDHIVVQYWIHCFNIDIANKIYELLSNN